MRKITRQEARELAVKGLYEAEERRRQDIADELKRELALLDDEDDA
jgi:transcription termination factor NusB